MENYRPEDYYPGVHRKFVEEFEFEFDCSRDIYNLKGSRKRGRWLQSSRAISSYGTIKPHPSLDPTLSKKPLFPDAIVTQFEPLDISKGKPIDLISLLLINSDTKSLARFDRVAGRLVLSKCVEDIQTHLKGKHVMLLCFHVPIYVNDMISGRLLDYSLFANEMSSIHSDKFETVLVVKMRPNWAHNQAAFTHFVSAFSPSCLVVPFQDTTRIDAICRCLDLQGARKGILVDPHGVVVMDDLKFVGSTSFMDSFPVTTQNQICCLSENWHNQTLDQLLGSRELKRCHSGDGSLSISVSELANNKVVGLYLCGAGSDITLLHKVYNECRAQHLDFEVVLVYVPFISAYSPEVIEDVIGSFLNDNKIPFWVSPFNYTVSLRLFNLTHASISDKLLIVSYGKLVELDGERFVHKLGSNAYPFDYESVIQRALGKIKKLTLKSLLEGGPLRRGNKTSDEVSVTYLKGENVILFLGSAVEGMYLYQLIEKHYGEIKHKHGGFEVVFVCLDAKISPPMEERISSMPWLVFHPDNSRSGSVIQALSMWGRKPEPSLVAFGADGLICSLKAEYALKLHGSDAFPFSADVRQQIATKLDNVQNQY